MPPKRGRRSTGNGRSAPPPASGNSVLGFLLGGAVAAGGAYLYLHSRPQPAEVPPTTTSTTPAPHHTPKPSAPHSAPLPPNLSASPAPEFPAVPAASPAAAAGTPPPAPFGISEDVFESGAHVYAARCSGCHGSPSHPASSASAAPQLWKKSPHPLSTRQPGEIYLAIATGAPPKGMPAYRGVLTDTQIWQTALLLKSSQDDLPDPVLRILNSHPGK